MAWGAAGQRLSGPAMLLLGTLYLPAPVEAAPADTLAGLWRALGACVDAGGLPPSGMGSEVTVLFSLTRSGALQGRPRITHSRLVGSEGDQRAFVKAALAALSRCLPLAITDGLGGAIAGRPLRFGISSRRPERSL